MPKETMIELLEFLAEQEHFSETEALLGKMAVEDVRTLLKTLASEMKQAAQHEVAAATGTSAEGDLSFLTKKVLAGLSDAEGEKLLRSFGLIDY